MSRTNRYICVLIILVLGIIYIFLIPPFEAPDEPAHFARAYGIAEGQFVLKDHPRQLMAYFVDQAQRRYPGMDIPIIKSIRQLLMIHSERIPNIAYNSSQYSPVCYLFYAAALKILMLSSMSLNVSQMLFACRVVSVLIFSVLMSIILKISKEMAWMLFWIAVTPMALSQASVVSPDGIVFCAASLMLVVSIQNVSNRFYVAWMVVSTFLLISTKPPYAPLLLVPLISLFRDKQIEIHRFIGLLAAVIISAASVLWWAHIEKCHGIYDLMMQSIFEYNSTAIDPERQFMMLLHSPANVCRLVANTLSSRGGIMLHEFVGILGWENAQVPGWVVVLWCSLLLYAVFVSNRPGHISYPIAFGWGMAAISAALITLVSVAVAVYLIWMPVGAPVVYLQGRYFHPIAVAFCMGLILIKFFKTKTAFIKTSPIIYFIGTLIIHAATFFMLLEKYYGVSIQ